MAALQNFFPPRRDQLDQPTRATGHSMTTTDATLVRRALDGSERAWHDLVRRHEKRVYNFALRMVGHREDAFDLMQEVFVALHRNLGTFRGDAQFTSWMLRIATYRCTDFLRRRRPTDTLDGDTLEDPATTPFDAAAGGNLNRSLTGALGRLPADQRLVLELKFFQQLTFEEIAAHLDISPNTAKTRMYAALRKLRLSSELEQLKDAM